ncbi:immunoglobulin kappa light chain-like [Girardinichthys multiradiatus]|uniref:immunoglobulin kappa light chain-like n=1 Tax=Girardinichthys multiradiatus TaxID=208333 RepID=UPI001FACF53B|nr:immunoglobulin kappa light chain-like [Girardinichthys multiradiatus]
MLFLPAAALCCLCSALAAMATQLSQKDLTLTRNIGETVSIGCTGFEICDTKFVYWYQKKETEPFVVILRFDRSGEKRTSTFNHPQKNSFSTLRKDGVELVISGATASHSATYYCVCHKSAYLIFGSGTKLYVTGDKVKPPVVNLYSVTSEYQQEKKQPLLCVASGMFPPVIRFSWRRQKENGPLEDLAPADGEHVELREAGRISSIWVVRQDPLYKYEYSCSVKHEGQVKEPQTKIVVFPPPPPPPSGPHWFRERLLCLLYSVLISKSLIYFCGLSLFSICGNQRA